MRGKIQSATLVFQTTHIFYIFFGTFRGWRYYPGAMILGKQLISVDRDVIAGLFVLSLNGIRRYSGHGSFTHTHIHSLAHSSSSCHPSNCPDSKRIGLRILWKGTGVNCSPCLRRRNFLNRARQSSRETYVPGEWSRSALIRCLWCKRSPIFRRVWPIFVGITSSGKLPGDIARRFLLF